MHRMAFEKILIFTEENYKNLFFQWEFQIFTSNNWIAEIARKSYAIFLHVMFPFVRQWEFFISNSPWLDSPLRQWDFETSFFSNFVILIWRKKKKKKHKGKSHWNFSCNNFLRKKIHKTLSTFARPRVVSTLEFFQEFARRNVSA